MRRPSLAQRIRAFMRPTPAPVIVADVEAWVRGHASQGWRVSIMTSYNDGFSISVSAKQDGGLLYCEIAHWVHGRQNLADAIREMDALVGGAAPDFDAAHKAREPRATLLAESAS
jgi:hypothetical protein